MNRCLKTLTLASLLAYSGISNSAVWSWIDTLTEFTCSYTYCFNYNFTISSWDEDDETPNPCYSATRCTIFIGHKHNAAGTSGTGYVKSWGTTYGNTTNNFLIASRTMGELGANMKSVLSLPFSGTTGHQADSIATEECVGLFYTATENLGSNETSGVSSSFQGHTLLPGSVCGTAPAPSGSCDFDVPSVTIDHGTLSKSEIEGHTASSSVTISCTSPKTVKLYIQTGDDLDLREDGSIYSKLYINNNSLGTDGLSVDVESQTSVDVSSVLYTNGTVAAGEFSGSAVMVITID